MRDVISVNRLKVAGRVGYDRFRNAAAEPLLLDVLCRTNVQRELEKSINYASLTDTINAVSQRSFGSLDSFASAISAAALSYHGVEALNLRVTKEKGLLKGTLHYQGEYSSSGECISNFHISGIDVDTIIGIHPWERQFKQKVVMDVIIPGAEYSSVTIDKLIQFLEQSSYEVLEDLVLDAARLAVVDLKHSTVTIKAAKPSALTFADSASVEVTRSASDFESTVGSSESISISDNATTVVLSLGSNLGNKKHNIQSALEQLEKRGVGKVVDTSQLYETAAMYVQDQPSFLNGACKITTTHSPHELLSAIKAIEKDLGRDLNGQVKGPRPIDMDILLYGDQVVKSDTLNIPHVSISERAFVLRPLCDIIPSHIPPTHSLTPTQALQRLDDPSLKLVLPVGDRLIPLREKRWVMGILNCTPDSFSDGGRSYSPDDAYANAVRMIDDGVDIIDVGGMSTRPNAPDVPAEEEVARVTPVIKRLRQSHPSVIISVDTFKASVAQAAVEAGADIVNDVSGGTADAAMFDTVAKLGVPYILMHMRGDSSTMTSLTEYDGGVVEGVQRETQRRVAAAIESGIRRWNLIIDPGLGFAKDLDGNLELLRHLNEFGGRVPSEDTSSQLLTAQPLLNLSRLPLLVGHSRKAFIGKITDVAVAKDRVAGTAATTIAAFAGGADIVRVHDVKESVDVAKMARAIYDK